MKANGEPSERKWLTGGAADSSPTCCGPCGRFAPSPKKTRRSAPRTEKAAVSERQGGRWRPPPIGPSGRITGCAVPVHRGRRRRWRAPRRRHRGQSRPRRRRPLALLHLGPRGNRATARPACDALALVMRRHGVPEAILNRRQGLHRPLRAWPGQRRPARSGLSGAAGACTETMTRARTRHSLNFHRSLPAAAPLVPLGKAWEDQPQ